MKIIQHGEVRVTDHGIFVEGFLAEPEADDPKDAKPEELLLALVIDWGWKIFMKEVNRIEKTALSAFLARSRERQTKKTFGPH
jgi:hypothetical protein